MALERECSQNEDCDYSFRVCDNGKESICENGCVYGKCTSCVPFCLNEAVCGNVSCMDSIRICPDGKSARCSNNCDNLGECSSCTPKCDIKTREVINYKVEKQGVNVDAVPCIDNNYTEKTEIREIKMNLSDIKLPKGYSMVIDPFSVECYGALDLTLNIPDTFVDLKVLRCKGDECNPSEVKSISELRCGGKVSREFLRSKEYIEPRLMPIKINEVSSEVVSGREIRSDKYNVRFNGNFEGLKATLSMPQGRIDEAKNPGLKITGTPMIIKVEGEVNRIKTSKYPFGINEDVDSIITMPYVDLEGFEEDSIGVYVKTELGWDYIGGKIDKISNTVTATIDNFGKYLNNDGEVNVALMAVLCISCYDSSLTKVYGPEKGSENAVILIHGFDPEPNTYQPLIDDIRLTNQPLDVWTLDYPSSKPLDKNIIEIMSVLEKNHANYKSIYIVAHSLGGLIIQKALYNSYLENKGALEKREPLKYGYLDKIRGVILAGAPNEGSPVVEAYRNLFKNLINEEGGVLFNPNSPVMEYMVKGMITPRVPNIEYKVIAGTESYGFNLLFFDVTTEKLAKIYEKNDGIITVKSAQHIGEGYVDDMCENYWELNVTHTDLIDDPLARRIIGKIISEGISQEDAAVLGRNRYFDLSVTDCSSEDMYVVIGRKIKEKEVLDETMCSCGNGYCGEGEDEINCPPDCALFLSKEERKNVFVFLILIFISFFAVYGYTMHRRFNHPHLKKAVEHIKNNYDIVPGEGYTSKQIRDSFLRMGWSKRVVNDCISVLEKEFHHAYHKPLKKHVKEHLKKGYTKEQIKRGLMGHGLKGELVDKVIRDEEVEPSFRLKAHKKKAFFSSNGKYFHFKE